MAQKDGNTRPTLHSNNCSPKSDESMPTKWRNTVQEYGLRITVSEIRSRSVCVDVPAGGFGGPGAAFGGGSSGVSEVQHA